MRQAFHLTDAAEHAGEVGVRRFDATVGQRYRHVVERAVQVTPVPGRRPVQQVSMLNVEPRRVELAQVDEATLVEERPRQGGVRLVGHERRFV